MDKELMQILVDLKIDSKAFTMLIDTILDNCRLNYSDDGLRIDSSEAILTVVKAFRCDEYNNRLEELKREKAELEEKIKLTDVQQAILNYGEDFYEFEKRRENNASEC